MAETKTQSEPATTRDDAAPDAAPVNSHEHFKTKGEHKFDRLTYNHIGYLANVALSLGAVYWVERTHGGQKFINNFVGKLKDHWPTLSSKTARWIVSRSFYLVGGFAVIPPMKWLEDHKVERVEKYDREIYGDAVDTDPQLIQSHKELEAAPKQSWPSIIGSRLLALVPFYAAIGLLWSHQSPLAKFTNPSLRALDGAGKKAALALENTNPSAFSKIMGKGFYFDRPIAALGRFAGKGFGRLTGNTQAVARIERMEKAYPGMLKEARVGSTNRDPNHSALPYYFVSEMITSASVAWGVFALTRLLAPIIGKKQDIRNVPALPETKATPEVLAKVKEEVANDDDTPRSQVKGHIEHTAPAAAALQAEQAAR